MYIIYYATHADTENIQYDSFYSETIIDASIIECEEKDHTLNDCTIWPHMSTSCKFVLVNCDPDVEEKESGRNTVRGEVIFGVVVPIMLILVVVIVVILVLLRCKIKHTTKAGNSEELHHYETSGKFQGMGGEWVRSISTTQSTQLEKHCLK